MAARPKTSDDIVRLKVTLSGIKPPVWRRLLVPSSISLDRLHVAIQASMGWANGHLHAFDIGDTQYSDPRMLEDAADESRLTVAEIEHLGIKRFGYTYDFGDDWEHVIELEGTEARVARQRYPTCIGGKRNCPPEDCGGIFGYEELLDIIADPSHPEHEDRMEWLEGDFDPEAFSLEDINKTLAAWLRRK